MMMEVGNFFFGKKLNFISVKISNKVTMTDPESKKIYDELNRFSTEVLAKNGGSQVASTFNKIYMHSILIEAVNSFTNNRMEVYDKVYPRYSPEYKEMLEGLQKHRDEKQSKLNVVYEKLLRKRFNCDANPSTEEKKVCAKITNGLFKQSGTHREIIDSSFCEVNFYNDKVRMKNCNEILSTMNTSPEANFSGYD
jgi:ribosome-associated toxin RatA of RatAB toxin-antitoxin module